MENEELFELGETHVFQSDLFCAPVKGKIEKIYENSVMIRVVLGKYFDNSCSIL